MQRLPDFELGLVVSRTHALKHPPGRWVGPWTWDGWLMEYTRRGEQELKVSGPGVNVPPFRRPGPAWYIYKPGVSYWHKDERPPEFGYGLWFFFHLKRRFPPLSDRPFTIVLDSEERLAPHVREMYALQQGGEPGAALIAKALAAAILAEVAAASQRGGAGTHRDPWRIRAAGADSGKPTLLQLVDAAALEHIRDGSSPAIDELAESLKMSVSSLAHRFRHETGITAMQRVRWLRIREARRLLAEPGASVKSVAAQLGFCSPFHLSKLFKDVTGVTARTYLRQQGVRA